jgi:hypothetical protein
MKLTSTRHLLGAFALSLALSGFGQTITVNEARPLARASDELEHKYGMLINYEDPPYVFSQDITDVTDSVARHPVDHRIFVPKGGSLTLSTNLAPTGKRVTTDEAHGLVAKLLDAYHAAGNPGTFTFSQTGDVFTIFPKQSRDRSGVVQNIKPILSTPISIEPQNVTTLKALEILCAKINDAVGQQEIGLGTIPMNSLQQNTVQLSASSEPARDVLEQILTVAGQGNGLVWRLFYAPEVDRYVLNIHGAGLEREEPTGKRKRLVRIQ